jgi:hypothetical protein
MNTLHFWVGLDHFTAGIVNSTLFCDMIRLSKFRSNALPRSHGLRLKICNIALIFAIITFREHGFILRLMFRRRHMAASKLIRDSEAGVHRLHLYFNAT